MMRTENEMYNLILKIAEEDERIKAVYMNGSRTNPNVPKDIFQDFDVVYVVTDTKSFIDDKEWINKFGEIWFMQYPDENPDYPSDKTNFYGWLMQFKDGNRIDLHVESVSHATEHIGDDKLCKILLDKKCMLPMAVTEENITDDIYATAKLSINYTKVKAGMPGNVAGKDMKECKALTLVMAGEKDCLFPAKRVLPRAEQIIENVTAYLLAGRGHMSSLTESEKQMIIEFLKRE